MRTQPKKTLYGYFCFYLGCLNCETPVGHVVEYYRYHLNLSRW